jgi:hypothetical protein
MKRFVRDTHGSAPIWAAFAILILFTLSFVVYAGVTVYTKYMACETELERAAVIAVDSNMENKNVRDVNIDIPVQPTQTDVESNLAAAGFIKSGSQSWKKYKGDKLLYEIRNLTVTVENERMKLSGLFVMPLPWSVGGQTEVEIPITARSRILFLK